MKLILAIAIVVMIATAIAHAGEYPTVKELEATRGFTPGAQLPFVVPAKGRGWNVYYMRGVAVGNGVYQVWIKLK